MNARTANALAVHSKSLEDSEYDEYYRAQDFITTCAGFGFMNGNLPIRDTKDAAATVKRLRAEGFQVNVGPIQEFSGNYMDPNPTPHYIISWENAV